MVAVPKEVEANKYNDKMEYAIIKNIKIIEGIQWATLKPLKVI